MNFSMLVGFPKQTTHTFYINQEVILSFVAIPVPGIRDAVSERVSDQYGQEIETGSREATNLYRLQDSMRPVRLISITEYPLSTSAHLSATSYVRDSRFCFT